MYFRDKGNTNIDSEFNDDSFLSRLFKIISKYKMFIIGIVIVILLIILMCFLFLNRKITNYLILEGEENITLYQGNDYIEPGYNAYNSKNSDLTSEVVIKSTLDVNEIGEYEISYSIGDVTKTRYITVIEKPKDYTYIYLKTVNNDINVYLGIREDYVEPGYQVFSSTGLDLTSQVKITGEVDTSKKGTYKLIYSVVDSNNVTITASRTVIVMDSEISLSLDNDKYTNNDVNIQVKIADNYFDYMILPDNTKITKSTYSYKVSENGIYTFKIYNTKGKSKEQSIKVKNIDRIQPTGSCTVDYDSKGSFIKVTASDNSGIKNYVYNNQIYITDRIDLTDNINSAKVTIYDNANNSKEITCTVVPKVYISNIKQDGVIITVNAKKIKNDITGYYFSYTNKRPNKDGGYIATNKESIDVVRLPGTTYVWVEDKSGKISEYKTVTISNDALLDTSGRAYTILKGVKLVDYLKNQGWSIEELNKLIARSVRAAGLYTKTGAATAAISLQTVLAQKYNIKLPYESAGVYKKFGVKSNWGGYGLNYTTQTSGYYGMDCSAFVTWTYVNAGYDIAQGSYPPYWGGWKKIDFIKENGEIGDILVTISNVQGSRHVKLIIGKSKDGFIIAEASGGTNGMRITTHLYSDTSGYKIEKGDNMIKMYTKYDNLSYPSGF